MKRIIVPDCKNFILFLLSVLCLNIWACGGNDENGNGEKNRPPVADAGPDLEGIVGEPVHITGTGADPDGDPLSYLWSIKEKPGGSKAELEGASQPDLIFIPDVEGVFVLGLVVNDGELSSEEDTMRVTARSPELISGSFIVNVVDYHSGDPVSGAHVSIDGEYAGQTDGEGIFEYSEPGLKGPLNVDLFYPEKRDAGSVELPKLRGVSIKGVNRSEISVPLKTAYEPPPPAMGRVAGHVHKTLLETLPDVGPVIPFNSNPCDDVEDFENDWEDCDPFHLEQVGSGQIRAVVVAPVTNKKPMDMEVSDLLGPPASADSPLPGNLTSDDVFLMAASRIIGIPAAPDGNNGLTWFELDLPAGKQQLMVLGVLITVDTGVLLDLLARAQAGDYVDPGAILGTMDLQTLMTGLVEVDVPAGDTYLFETEPFSGEPPGLTPEDLDHIYFIPAEVEFHHAVLSDSMNPELESQRRWAEISYELTGKVSSQGILDDPRLESHVPDRAPIRVGDRWEWLDVPAETGVPDTHVPYSIVVALAETEIGLLPVGLAFTRAGNRYSPEALFGLPRNEEFFSGSTLEAVGFTSRGIGPTGPGGAYELLYGQAIARTGIITDSTVDLMDPLPFPDLTEPHDAGLDVGILFERTDRDTTEVTGSSAYLRKLEDPDQEAHILSDKIILKTSSDAHIAIAVLYHRDEETKEETPVWEFYADTGEEVIFSIPRDITDILSGGEVRIDVMAVRWSSPFDMERWSGERIRTGPATYTVDTWLAVIP